MAPPPDPILAAIAQGPETGEVLGALETRGEHVFAQADGCWWRASIWWVVTERHTWLAATVEGHHWAIGTGDPRDVAVDTSWTRDVLRVGEWAIPLRGKTRKAAQNLVGLWEKTRWGGEPWPAPREAEPAPRAPLAEGATSFPEWWAGEVPADPDERWLAAGLTAALHPFSHRDGTVHQEPLWLGISDRRAVLAVRSGEGDVSSLPLSGPIQVDVHPGPNRYTAPERTFSGPALAGAALTAAARLSRRVTPEARWAEAARQALEDGVPTRALALWGGAFALGRAGRSWEDVARACASLGQGEHAVHALCEHLRLRPDDDTLNGPGRWQVSASALERSLRRVTWSEAWVALRPLLEAVTPREPPSRLRWPPTGSTEVWIGALCASERWESAIALLPRLDQGPRGSAIRAAVRTLAGAEGVAEDWVAAAHAARAAHLNDDAR
ncbi:MAG: hypothetical protein JRI25_16655, partial [Deltaproteobacteria bacterium]|nr:hypothetical protein [Deltaproteobacteria bacterium]